MPTLLFATLLLAQNPQPPATNDQITDAFTRALDIKTAKTLLFQKTIQGQLTILAKNGDEPTLLVYDYSITIGRSPFDFRSEGSLKVGLEAKIRPFLIVSNTKNITIYDQTKNIYHVTSQKISTGQSLYFIGLIPFIYLTVLRNTAPSLAVPQISDPQAAKEAIAIFPKLFAQQGILSATQEQEPDGRYSIHWVFKTERSPTPGKITTTLDATNDYFGRFRAEIPLEEGSSMTITDVVKSITPEVTLPKFTFQVPPRAKKVKELPALLDSL